MRIVISLCLQIAGIQKLVDDAVANGARLLAGGKVNTKYDTGAFYEPTLLVDVTPSMQIAQKEVFGPVMVIMKAQDDEDALRIVCWMVPYNILSLKPLRSMGVSMDSAPVCSA